MKPIKLENISKRFGSNTVLRDISLEVDKGSVFGFFGSNGSGKTTTMRIMLDLLEPDAGKALIFGMDFGQHADVRRRVGVLLEDHGMYERLTARMNLAYYCALYRIDEERIDEVLSLVGLKEKADVQVAKFSTGMKKKIGIARALLHRPELLLLDEPTSGLDPEAQIEFRDLILDLSNRDITFFINTHNLAEAQKICSHIAILHGGVIPLQGKLTDIQKKHGTDLEKIYMEVVR